MKFMNITAPDRRSLARTVAAETEMEPQYAGPPTFNYTVGDITIDREGVVEVPDDLAERIKALLIEKGWMEPDPVVEPEPERLSIWLPADDMTPAQITNLIHMLYSKQYLIGRSLGTACIRIEDAVINRLHEYTPANRQDYEELLRDFIALGDLEGVELANDRIRIDFPIPTDAEHSILYNLLATRILKAAKDAKRVFPEKLVTESEKYFMRGWILRLGLGGSEYKAVRNMLLKDLKGHSAFPNDEKAKQHTERWTAIRHEHRARRLAQAKNSEADEQAVTSSEKAVAGEEAVIHCD